MDDLLTTSVVLESEEQKRIKELLANGYSQANPMVSVGMMNQGGSKGKENHEASLVNLEDIMGNKTS